MPTTRRRMLPAMGLAAIAPAQMQESSLTPQALHGAAQLRGEPLAADRLRVLQPVLDRRRAQLKPLRDFVVGDAISPIAVPKRRGR